jgi:putative zinc finger/helix-turn-helix YgiT family protein
MQFFKETYPVKGEDVTIDARICTCSVCGKRLWNAKLDEENVEKAYRAYQHKHKLLLPAQIKQIREKYQLSQSAFAKLLGFGEKTITRYENGYIQDEVPNNLIYLVNDTNAFMLLYNKNKDKLTEAERQRIDRVLRQFYGCSTTYYSGEMYSFNSMRCNTNIVKFTVMNTEDNAS